MKTSTLLTSTAFIGLLAAAFGWHFAVTNSAPVAVVSKHMASAASPSPVSLPAPEILMQAGDCPLPDPKAMLQTLAAGDDAEQLATARADFARSADADSVRQLVALYQNQFTTPEQRLRLLETLRVVINPPSIDTLRAVAADSEDPTLSLAASTSLAKIGSAESLVALTDIYRQSKSESLRLEVLDVFLHSDPLPEAKELLQALAERAASDPWGMAASELLLRTPDPVIDGNTLAAIPQLTPAAK